jgi:2-oxoglutarate ferredoxin oxidoreductase subunit gamma
VSFRYEVRLSGEGGQGLILAGKILAEAAAIYSDLNAAQSQSYGPEARGGASRSEVILSDGDIDYPKAMAVDLLLAFTQESCDKYSGDLKESGTLVVDSDAVTRIPEGDFRVFEAPIIRTAEEKCGRRVVANILALGLIGRLLEMVTTEALEAAVRSRVPRGTEDLNLKAFRFGVALADELLDKPVGQ